MAKKAHISAAISDNSVMTFLDAEHEIPSSKPYMVNQPHYLKWRESFYKDKCVG